jgi:hypothetical protein
MIDLNFDSLRLVLEQRKSEEEEKEMN